MDQKTLEKLVARIRECREIKMILPVESAKHIARQIEDRVESVWVNMSSTKLETPGLAEYLIVIIPGEEVEDGFLPEDSATKLARAILDGNNRTFSQPDVKAFAQSKETGLYLDDKRERPRKRIDVDEDKDELEGTLGKHHDLFLVSIETKLGRIKLRGSVLVYFDGRAKEILEAMPEALSQRIKVTKDDEDGKEVLYFDSPSGEEVLRSIAQYILDYLELGPPQANIEDQLG